MLWVGLRFGDFQSLKPHPDEHPIQPIEASHLDDTLADDRFATEQAILALWRSQTEGTECDAANLSARWLSITDKHWRRFRAGETSLQGQRRDRLAEMFGLKFTDAEADRLFEEYLGHYEHNWRLVVGAHDFLTATAELPKIIVTNSEINQATRKVALLNIGSHFAAIVTPEVAGAPKPKPEIFKHALEALGMATFHVSNAPGQGLREAVRAA